MSAREEIELYMMGEYDGDKAALESTLADDPALRAIAAQEAELEMLLRDAGAAALFCVGCDDLVERDAQRCNACGAATRPGGYAVDRVLVSNAHGRMYLARDVDGKQVALKELAFVQTPTLEVIAMFEREAKFLRALEHPAIPRFVASFEEGTGVHARYYLAQELVTGTSLEQRLNDHFFSETEILDIARQVLEVLVYLQTVSPMVIHRDIKPANLIARSDGKIAVVDFGAAHVQGTTAGSTSIGTFGYMPIEQLAGQVDATTDAFALGASLLHLLSRREPWRILQGASLEGINVSPPLRDFLAKLVAPEPVDRFANATAALEALEKVTRGERLSSSDRAKVRRTLEPRGWLRPVMMAAAAIALAVGGFGVHALMSSPAEPSPDNLLGAVNEMAVSQMTSFTEEMCRCADAACADHVHARHERWGAELTSLVPAGLASHETTQQMIVLNQRYAACSARVRPEKTLKVDFGAPPPAEAIPAGKPIDLDFKATSLLDVLRVVGDACGLSIVAPDHIDTKITINVKQAPCDQALEVLLESHGLWYRYRKTGNIVLVAPRVELDRDAEARRTRDTTNLVDDQLPLGPDVDLDFKGVPLPDLMRMFADMAKVNVVIPDHIGGRVTVKLKKTPWGIALRTILESHGLWYRYRPNGKLLRIAPRVELDREDEAARIRAKASSTGSAPANHTEGSLTIESKPHAAVWIDGKDTGLMTPSTMKLPAGKHKLMLVVANAKHTYFVDVKAGENIVVVKDLSP